MSGPSVTCTQPRCSWANLPEAVYLYLMPILSTVHVTDNLLFLNQGKRGIFSMKECAGCEGPSHYCLHRKKTRYGQSYHARTAWLVWPGQNPYVFWPGGSLGTRLCLSFTQYEPRREKTCLQGFQTGPTQTRMYNHTRWLDA